GVLGTALTPEQVKRLAGFCSRLELLFDGDGPGRKAALRGAAMAIAKGMRCAVVLMPEGEDIDSLLHGAGTEAFEKLRGSAPDGLDFCIRTLAGESPSEAVGWVKDFLRQVELPELLPSYVSRLARGLDLDEAALRRDLPAFTAPEAARAGGRNPAGLVDGELPVPERGLEVELMRYVVRNPGHLPALREYGAELLLGNAFFRELWTAVADCAPDFMPDDIFAALADKQRAFWVATRMNGPGDGADDPEKKGRELAEIRGRLSALGSERQSRTCLTAIRHTSSGDEYDAELLKAMTETVRRKHGQY
ncbi:MAG: toprim domain-containing protein, partial [Deltaproteobacteria bacterium]|nr:toprim domain-containing protein [Deltaproteobacteria bacterium]